MDLNKKVVVITGGSKGLGLSLAREFLAEKCRVVISSRNGEDLMKATSELGVEGIPADVRNEDQVASLANQVMEKFGRIDIWVNNAGVRIPESRVEETDWKRAHDMMEINMFGTVYGSKAAVSKMKEGKSGMIINILSTAALAGKAGRSAYSASKQAAKGFTESLRAECREHNITVVSVFPGGMRTHFFDEEMPPDYADYMDPDRVARSIVDNAKADEPDEELTIKRPTK